MSFFPGCICEDCPCRADCLALVEEFEDFFSNQVSFEQLSQDEEDQRKEPFHYDFWRI